MRAFLLVLAVVFYFTLLSIGAEPKEPMLTNALFEAEYLEDGRLKVRISEAQKETPPAYTQCVRITPTSGFSLSLNAAGEGKFGEHATDVNEVLGLAIAEANSSFLANSETGYLEFCEDEYNNELCRCEDGQLEGCMMVAGAGNRGKFVTGGQVSANVRINLASGQSVSNSEECEPGVAEALNVGIHVTASAPGKTGWDFGFFLSQLKSDGSPGQDAYVAEILSAWAGKETLTDHLGGGGTWWAEAFNAVTGAYSYILIMADASIVSIQLHASSGWTQVDYTPDKDMSNATSDVTLAHRVGESMFPENSSLHYHAGTLKEITETISLGSTGGANPSFSGGSSASLVAGGGGSYTSLPWKRLRTPYIPGGTCVFDLTYVTDYPVPKLVTYCKTAPMVLRLWTDGPHKIRRPMGRSVQCQIEVYHTFPEPIEPA